MAGQVEHVPVGRAREPVAAAMVLDAMRLLGVLLTAAWSRRPIRPLADEAVRPLPGDELVADAKVRWTASKWPLLRTAERGDRHTVLDGLNRSQDPKLHCALFRPRTITRCNVPVAWP
jgi:hypothetical protein